MIAYTNQKNEMSTVDGNPVIIISVDGDKIRTTGFVDGRVDHVFRTTQSLDDVKQFIHRVIEDHDPQSSLLQKAP